MQYQQRRQAVVLGGSMAGMLAARVLADHFDHVIVLERDSFPDTIAHREGVPQSRHIHALLMRGHVILEELFPGITDDWERAGAEVLDLGRDFTWRNPAGWGVRFDSGVKMLAASRPLIDWAVHRRLSRLRNVSIYDKTAVGSLLATEGGRRITGVAVRRDTISREVIDADLVVDATGRMSRAPEWLESLGYGRPEESVVDAHLGYATRLYRRRNTAGRDWKAVMIQAAPPERPRAGLAFPLEGGRWIVTLCGGGGDYAPREEEAFREFARSLPSAEVYNVIRESEPLGPILAYRRTENRWRHYERMPKMPEGFIVLGDAACAFNPVYGQGMTVAALGALLLRRCLYSMWREGSEQRFQRDLANVIATPWALATGEDVLYKGTNCAKPTLAERFLQAYVAKTMAVTTYDPMVRLTLLKVFTMMQPPARLFDLRILLKLALHVALRKAAPSLDTPALEDATAVCAIAS